MADVRPAPATFFLPIMLLAVASMAFPLTDLMLVVYGIATVVLGVVAVLNGSDRWYRASQLLRGAVVVKLIVLLGWGAISPDLAGAGRADVGDVGSWIRTTWTTGPGISCAAVIVAIVLLVMLVAGWRAGVRVDLLLALVPLLAAPLLMYRRERYLGLTTDDALELLLFLTVMAAVFAIPAGVALARQRRAGAMA